MALWSISSQEIGEGLNAKVNPTAKVGIGKVSQLQIFFRIESRLFFKRRHGIVIEAGPSVFPAVEVGHPVGNVDVDTVNSGRRDLPDALHVSSSPFRSIRTNPNILIAGSDPKGRAAAKDRGFTRDFALQPVGMILGYCVGDLVAMSGDAFGSGDVDEGVVSRRMRFFCHGTNRLQLRGRVKKAFVAAGYVVIHLDPEDTRFLGVRDDLIRAVPGKTVGADAHIVRPILFDSCWRG